MLENILGTAQAVPFTFPLFDGTISFKKGGGAMQQLFYELKNFFRKGDMVLLVMCLSISAFGCLVIASTNNYRGFLRYVLIQVLAIALGVLVFAGSFGGDTKSVYVCLLSRAAFHIISERNKLL